MGLLVSRILNAASGWLDEVGLNEGRWSIVDDSWMF